MIVFQVILCLLLLSLSSLSSSTTITSSQSSSTTTTSLLSSTMTYMSSLMNNIITTTSKYFDNVNTIKHIIDNDKSDSIVYHDWGNSNIENDASDNIVTRDALKRLLFPNISIGTYHLGGYHDIDENSEHGRKLAPIVKPPYDPATTICLKCSGMKKCSILENLLIMEVYLPNNPEARGTCNVIEALGQRMYDEVFGNGKTFRDTTQCKDIVMQYLCLFWGSDNNMYTNYCINQEDYTSVNPLFHKISPRPPCRSFCVQLADVCANDPGFINICNEIACPPKEDKCVPDPQIEGQSLAANIGCDMPFFFDPYAPKSDGSSVQFNYFLLLLSIIISMLWIHND